MELLNNGSVKSIEELIHVNFNLKIVLRICTYFKFLC